MTIKEFNKKYGQISLDDVSNALMRVNSNLSDLQHMTNIEDRNRKLNALKGYVSDLRIVVKKQLKEQEKKQ